MARFYSGSVWHLTKLFLLLEHGIRLEGDVPRPRGRTIHRTINWLTCNKTENLTWNNIFICRQQEIVRITSSKPYKLSSMEKYHHRFPYKLKRSLHEFCTFHVFITYVAKRAQETILTRCTERDRYIVPVGRCTLRQLKIKSIGSCGH